jgi:hypothetical protein
VAEHKGVNNRTIRELGWVTDLGKRDSPRTSELRLQSDSELLEKRKVLMRLRKEPEQFVAFVFQSRDSIWAERCISIIVDE